MARPGVVWFGESLPPGIWSAAEEAVRSCDLLLVVGTSAVVYPAAGLVPLARLSGAKVMEINIEAILLAGLVHTHLNGPAGEILPKLIQE